MKQNSVEKEPTSQALLPGATVPVVQQPVRNELGEMPIGVQAWGCHVHSF
jgi:hypothetical protein